MTSCTSCGAALREASRFCPECGSATPDAARERRSERLAEDRTVRGAIHGIAIVYGGVILSIVTVAIAAAVLELGEVVSLAITYSLFAACGAIATLVIGNGAWRESLAGIASPRSVLIALAFTPPLLALNFGYHAALLALLDPPDGFVGATPETLTILTVLATAVLPALAEEWLDRGVLWTACRRVASTRTTIAMTASLFALSHGLAALPLAFPYFFVFGWIAGELRARSGSLIPGIALHFAHNLAVLLI